MAIPRRVFSGGQVVTAAQMNDLVWTGHLTYDSAAARDSDLQGVTIPVGAAVRLLDTLELRIWDGDSWEQAEDPIPDPPGNPRSVTSTVLTARQIRVGWVAPSTGGTSESYTVRYRVSSATDWLTQTSTELQTTIVGLTPGTEYQMQVRASNTGGDSNYVAAPTRTTTAVTQSVRINTSQTYRWPFADITRAAIVLVGGQGGGGGGGGGGWRKIGKN